MAQYSISEIATALGAEALGDAGLRVSRAAEPADAGPGDLALAMNPKYASDLSLGRARAALVWKDADWRELGLAAAIPVTRTRMAMAGLTRAMDGGPAIAHGVHPTASVDPTARIGEDAAIGAFVAIGAGVAIGARARVASHVSIAEEARIGDDALIHSGVRIGARVEIGDRFIAQPNAVVGGDGFSFATPEVNHAETARGSLGAKAGLADQPWERIHSLGAVEIGDDVEVGTGSAIDRGTIRATTIGNGTKIDNLVHIGHNCRIGRDCLICGQVGFGGSAVIGNSVVLGGQTGVADNIFVGDAVVASGATVLISNVPAGRMMMGYPGVRMDAHVEIYKALRRLPRLSREVADLKIAVSKDAPQD